MTPPFSSVISTMWGLLIVAMLGKLRDLFSVRRMQTRKGYAPILDSTTDFFNRRMFGRIKDLWNRPLGSAPGAWIDVLDRTEVHGTSGQQDLKLLGTSTQCLNLGSYNYLGFAASDVYCTPRVQETLQEWGVSTCSSRVDAGTTPLHDELETMIAAFVGKEAALTYGMGFATNSSTIPALVGKGCLILSDALNHASIVSGVRMSGAKVKVFRHNDAKHLEALLRESIAEGQPRTHRPWKKVLIIVEGIYSMEGEVCTLKDIVEVKKKYKAYLFLDEAHSIGAMGKSGRGVCEHCGVDPKDVDIMMGTFTKSFGSCGGYVAANRDVIQHLRVSSPAHLYATSMSAAAVQQVISALRVVQGLDGSTRGVQKIRQLHDNANYFRRRLNEMGFDVLGDWDSPVMPIMIYHPAKLPLMSRTLYQWHVAIVCVGFPVTSMMLSRMRVCISAAHSHEDLEYGLEVFEELGRVAMLFYKKGKNGAKLQGKVANAHGKNGEVVGKASMVKAGMR